MYSLFKKYQGFIVISFCVGCALISYSSSLKATSDTSLATRTVLNIYEPPLLAFSFLLKEARSCWDNYISLLRVQEENQELRQALALLTEQNVRTKELALENARLRNLLLLKEQSPAQLISAEIIGRDAIGWFKTVLINKGRNDAIQKNQAVITHQGVVGRCIEVADSTSKVLLITDINSSVDALVQITRSRGILQGKGSALCELTFISSADDVEVGDLVVTTGLCGVFPKGLSIGTVTKVEKTTLGLFHYVEVEPSINLNKLEEVSILLPEGG
jgi:rod shape-determining protein MreC